MTEEFQAKTREWAPVPTNQIRLRHLRQICVRRVATNHPPSTNNVFLYYTLHVTTMSSPFYTSECLSGENIDWGDIDTRKFPDDIVSSCPGVVVRIWVKDGREEAASRLVNAWGVYFTALEYLGPLVPKEAAVFRENTVVFVMPWGCFTAKSHFNAEPVKVEPSNQSGNSYSLPTMCRIHRLQRAIYKEKSESERLRQEIQAVQSNPYRYQKKSRSLSFNSAPIDYAAIVELQSKRQEIAYTVDMLQHERNRQHHKVEQFKGSLKRLKSENHSKSQELKENYLQLQIDKEKLSDLIKDVAVLEDQVWRVNQQLIERRRQLFQELAFIFPIVQVKEKVWTINNVALPDSDSFNGCDDVQLSVALGYVAHLVHMISVFIQIPNRYPITVYSSMSRITDLITKNETDAPKEFPLYSKGKDRIHFEYGVYLLNKNIAQLRWLFGMPTPNLAATLSNLATLMLHLTTPPPNEDKKQMKETSIPRTSSSSSNLYRYKSSKLQPQRVSSLAGSQASLTGSASTQSLDRLPDSPVQSSYFKKPPEATVSTLSLDLAIDRPLNRSIVEAVQKSALHGSAPDLRSPEADKSAGTFEHAKCPEEIQVKNETIGACQIEISSSKVDECASDSSVTCQRIGRAANDVRDPVREKLGDAENEANATAAEKPAGGFESLFNDDEISSVSARTEALAISTGTFKMNRRGQST